MPKRLAVVDFLSLSSARPIIDVRTPAEYRRGHIPDAVNMPLLTNEERVAIGTLYKQAGRSQAVVAGLEAVGPKMGRFASRLGELANERGLLVHCWRGGMRSESVAWLAGLLGHDSQTLDGGYKAFRSYVLDSFARPQAILVLGGYTGSGKTSVLRELADRGEQVIDLEGLARHKGSAFGELGEAPQPTQQQFENDLALLWQRLDPDRPVWLEDESRRIGAVAIPEGMWRQMRTAMTLFIDVPVTLRRGWLVETYGAFDKAEIAGAVRKIQKRLGGAATRRALDALERGDLAGCAELLLAVYYDKAYRRGLETRQPSQLRRIVSNSIDPSDNAVSLLEEAASLNGK